MREAKKFIRQSAKPPQINQVLPPSPRRASGFIAGISRERERQLGGKTVGTGEVGRGSSPAPPASLLGGGAGTCRRWRPGRHGARRASPHLQEARGEPLNLPPSPGRWNGFAPRDPGREALGACGGAGRGAGLDASVIGLSGPPRRAPLL